MRQILRGYTMYESGVDYGYEIEEVMCPLPDETYTEHNYGGAVMTAEIPMVKIGLLNPTIKFQSHNPKVAGLLLKPAGTTSTFTFRAALVDEIDGAVRPNVIVYEGRLAAPSTDQWSRDDKSGIEYTIKGVRYFRYEIGNDVIHEMGLFPARMKVNGVDLLSGINAALGR